MVEWQWVLIVVWLSALLVIMMFSLFDMCKGMIDKIIKF
jgi:hypothetical protein